MRIILELLCSKPIRSDYFICADIVHRELEEPLVEQGMF
jgi:hypothetical protein